MKVAIILFHKNVLTYLPSKYVIECLESIEGQTFQNFDVFEINYGGDDVSIIKHFKKLLDKKHYFYKEKLKDHSYAMNYILNKVFNEYEYDYCFNINIDDVFHKDRFNHQLKYLKKLDYDLISSNMIYINEESKETKNIDYLAYNFKKNKSFKSQIKDEQEYIRRELKRDHNIIANPCVCFNKRFWKLMGPYTNTVPREDLDMYQKAILSGRIKIHITKRPYLYYRIHGTQITCTQRSKSTSPNPEEK